MKTQEHEAMEKEISQLSEQIEEMKQRVATLRRELPRESVADYTFQSVDGPIKLSRLFGEGDELIVVHNMGSGCPYCTLWADGLNGVVAHLEDRAAFVVVSPDAPEDQRRFADGRGWKFRVVSSKGSKFTRDMGFETEKDGYWPGFSTFLKGADGNIYRIAHAMFGPGDDYCAVWHLFDLLPNGQNGWEPKYRY